MRLFWFVGTYVVLSTTGLLLLRTALSEHVGGMAAVGRDPRVLVGGAFYVASFLSWLIALRTYPLTTIYPVVVGAGYSAVVVSSAVFLGERLTPLRLVGIALIAVGVILIVR